MTTIGYWLSSEEHTPSDLVRHAQRAEELGFTDAMISDHFHPWIDRQGQAPFVWSVLAGIACTTKNLKIGTGVTCPIIRTHPAIIAQAAATTAAMMPGRFFLGVGTGENLNEHITGEHWPPFAVRLAMLEESIEIMRALWEGGLKSHRGKYYTVENARLYTLPEEPVQIMVAAAGKESATMAGRVADGFVNSSSDREPVEVFEKAGGKGKPRHGQLSVCWAKTREEAIRTAYEIWPTSALKGDLGRELPLPKHFEDAASIVTEDMIAESAICGPDPEPYLEKIREFEQAGFTHIYLHQIGPDQEGFFNFYTRELAPQLGR
jgi:coenzyme F420-dependent glucose-6-phosphate dehydrogenase